MKSQQSSSQLLLPQPLEAALTKGSFHGCQLNTCRFWWLQKSAGCQGMAPHAGIPVPIAAHGCTVSPKHHLHLPHVPRKSKKTPRKQMGILAVFALPSPRHLPGARQGRGSARSLQCPDSFLTSCNCFPATTLLSRELLAKAICSPSIFISLLRGRENKEGEGEQTELGPARAAAPRGKDGEGLALQAGRTWQP